MITKDQRTEIANRIAEHIAKPENEGRIGGLAGVCTAPQLYYLDDESAVRSATVVGFWGSSVILAGVGTGRVLSIQEHLVYVHHEDALCDSAEQQKKLLEAAQANYLATCRAAANWLAENKKSKRK